MTGNSQGPLRAEGLGAYDHKEVNSANNQWVWKRTLNLRLDCCPGWHFDCSLGKPWAEDPVYPCLISWLMETDIIDGCSKFLNCANLWCSNRELIQHDFSYHQMTVKFIYPARLSLAYPTVYLTSSRGCLEGTSVSVCAIRLSCPFILSQVQWIAFIIPQVKKQKNLGVIFYTFLSFVLYIQCIKNSNLFRFLEESTLVWFTHHLLCSHQICLPSTLKDDKLKITFIFLCSWDFSWRLASVRQMVLCEFCKVSSGRWQPWMRTADHLASMYRK